MRLGPVPGTHVHNFSDPVWLICRRTKQAVGAIVKGKRNEYLRECFDGRQTGGEQQSRQDGTAERITMMKTLQTHQINPTAFLRALLFGVIRGWPSA